MNALDWIKSKAEAMPLDAPIEITAEIAAEDGIEPGIYQPRTVSFRGTLPARMIPQVKRALATLRNNALECETLRIGGQYRGDYGLCEYSHTIYRKIGA